MDLEIVNKLYQPLELKERRGAGQQMYKYISNEDVIDRMNRTFAGDWSTTVVYKEIIDDQLVVEVIVSATDSVSKMQFSHTGFGSHPVTRFTSGDKVGKIVDIGNVYKSALAKGIVNACSRWGVGLFKDRAGFTTADDDGADELVMPSISAPPVAVIRPAPAPVTAAPAPIAIPTPVAPAPVAPVAPVVPVAPVHTVSVPAGITGAPKMPISAPKISLPTSKVEVPKPIVSAPAPAAVAPAPAVPSFVPPQDLPFSSSEDLGLISDVQRVALNGILSMRNLNYIDLAVEAYAASGITKEIVPAEQLKYEDAVVIIKYGNEKYRKNK